MAGLSEEEKEILRHAYDIKQRLKAEELEAGESEGDLFGSERKHRKKKVKNTETGGTDDSSLFSRDAVDVEADSSFCPKESNFNTYPSSWDEKIKNETHLEEPISEVLEKEEETEDLSLEEFDPMADSSEENDDTQEDSAEAETETDTETETETDTETEAETEAETEVETEAEDEGASAGETEAERNAAEKEARRQQKEEVRKQKQQQKEALKQKQEEKRQEKQELAKQKAELRQQKADEKKQKAELRQQKVDEKKQKADEKKSKVDEKQQKSDKKHRILKGTALFILMVVVILAVLLTALFLLVKSKISQTNYAPYTTSYVRQSDVMSDRHVKNILLLGTDARAATDTSRSDCIIILSINERTHKLFLTSILRDSYVEIKGYGQNRINHAYQMGGAALLAETIEENFKIAIDYYVTVDFYSFIDIIDAVGGVTINVTQEEFNLLNGYVSEINHIIGAPEGDQFVPGPGLQVLTGREALGYARIRYVGTDFQRTERQRTVLNAMFSKVKSADLLTLYKVADSILPDLTTDIPDNMIVLLMGKALLYRNYDVVQNRVPADGTWWNTYAAGQQEVLGMDFNANISYLQSTIYGN